MNLFSYFVNSYFQIRSNGELLAFKSRCTSFVRFFGEMVIPITWIDDKRDEILNYKNVLINKNCGFPASNSHVPRKIAIFIDQPISYLLIFIIFINNVCKNKTSINLKNFDFVKPKKKKKNTQLCTRCQFKYVSKVIQYFCISSWHPICLKAKQLNIPYVQCDGCNNQCRAFPFDHLFFDRWHSVHFQRFVDSCDRFY